MIVVAIIIVLLVIVAAVVVVVVVKNRQAATANDTNMGNSFENPAYATGPSSQGSVGWENAADANLAQSSGMSALAATRLRVAVP